MSNFTDDDRALLTTLSVQVAELKETVRDIKNKIEADVFVKRMEYDRKRDDFEGRIRRLEFYGSLAIGALYAINAGVGIYLQFIR